MGAFSLIILIACAHFTVDCMLSLFPAYKTMASIDLGIAGLIAGSSIFFAEAMQLYFGKLIDQGLHKCILIIGILGATGASLFSYTEDLVVITLLLFSTYLGSACFHPAAASILGSFSGHTKHIAMGIFATCGMAGMCVGQLLFTWIIEYMNGQTAILGMLGIMCALTLYCKNLSNLHTHHQQKTFSLTLFIRFFRSKPLKSLYFVQLANQTLVWSTVFLLPDLLKARAYDEWIVFGGGHFFFIFGAAISPIPAGIISAKATPQRTIAFSFFFSILFLAQLIFIKDMPNTLLMTNLFMYGVCLGAIPPIVYALGNELVPFNRGMVSVFLMGMVWIVSETIGLGGSGIIADIFQEDGAEYSLLILGATSSLLGSYYATKLHRLASDEFVFIPNH